MSNPTEEPAKDFSSELRSELQKTLQSAIAELSVAETAMRSSGWWINTVGYQTDAALWLSACHQTLVDAHALADGERSK